MKRQVSTWAPQMMGRQITNEIIFVIVQIVVIFTLNVISSQRFCKQCQKMHLAKVLFDKEISLSGQRNPATFFSAKSDESEFVT